MAKQWKRGAARGVASLAVTVMVTVTVIAGCGGGGGGFTPGPGGGDGAVTTGDMATTTTPFDAAKVCMKILASSSSCAQPGAQAQCEQALNTASTRGCADWQAQLQTWVLNNAQPYACMTFGGVTVPTISSQAPEGAKVGDACSAAVVNASCYGIACQHLSDCPSGSTCNDATKHCVKNAARCGGLPCSHLSDCPSGQTCNSALHVCSMG